MDIIMLSIIIFVILVLGGGLAYVLFLISRPKKMTWEAKVYQLGSGVQKGVYDKYNRLISDSHLRDLRFYTNDVLEKVFKKDGTILFRLQKLQKLVDRLPEGAVDVIDGKKREITILLDGETATVMEKGYDEKTGKLIFRPMPHDRINLIKGELSEKEARYKESKSILEAITPWIVTGICIIGLVAIAYIIISGFIEISENLERAQVVMAEEIGSRMDELINTVGGRTQTVPNPPPTTVPPVMSG